MNAISITQANIMQLKKRRPTTMLLLLLLLLLLCSSSFQYIRISNYIFFCYRLAITVLGVTISSTIFVRATNCDIRTCACEHACLISICVHTLDRTPCRMRSEQKEKDETEAAKKEHRKLGNRTNRNRKTHR